MLKFKSVSASLDALLSEICELPFPYAGYDTIEELMVLKKVNVVVTDCDAFSNSLRKSIKSIDDYYDEFNLRRENNQATQDDYILSDYGYSIKERLSNYLERIPGEQLLGLFSAQLGVRHDKPIVYLFKDNIESYSISHAVNQEDVYAFVFVHEMMHAYYNSSGKQLFPPDEYIEEPFAENGMLGFFQKNSACPSIAAARRAAETSVRAKFNSGPYHYGFGIELNNLSSVEGVQTKLVERYREVSNMISYLPYKYTSFFGCKMDSYDCNEAYKEVKRILYDHSFIRPITGKTPYQIAIENLPPFVSPTKTKAKAASSSTLVSIKPVYNCEIHSYADKTDLNVKNAIKERGMYPQILKGIDKSLIFKVSFVDNSISVIEPNSFQKCPLLKSVKLPKGLQTIGEYAFADRITRFNESPRLTIEMPSSLITIGEAAFMNCGKIKCVLNDGLETIGKDAFRGAELYGGIEVPDSVISIGDRSFYETSGGCVTIKARTNIIPKSCFEKSSVKSVFLSDHISEIAEHAFRESEISLIAGIGYVPRGNADNCQFTELDLPSTVKVISNAAFSHCGRHNNSSYHSARMDIGAMKVNLNSGLESIGDNAFSSISFSGDVIVPASVTRIGQSAFSDSKIGMIEIKAKVTSLPEACFENSEIGKVSLANRISVIGPFAFANAKLHEIRDINRLEIIDKCAFYCCTKDYLSLENSSLLKSIGDKALVLKPSSRSNNVTIWLPDMEYVELGAFPFMYGTKLILPKNSSRQAIDKVRNAYEESIKHLLNVDDNEKKNNVEISIKSPSYSIFDRLMHLF